MTSLTGGVEMSIPKGAFESVMQPNPPAANAPPKALGIAAYIAA